MLYLVIDGTTYDVTNFEHPGGLAMLRMAGRNLGGDATILFATHHHGTLANTTLKQLPVITPSAPPETSTQNFNMDTYNQIKSEIIDIHRINCYKYTYFWFLSNLILFLSGMYTCCQGCFSVTVICWTIFQVHLGFTLFHYLHHGGLYRRFPKIAKCLEWFMNLSTYHGDDWKADHNLKHHLKPNDPQVDDDISAGLPFLRLHQHQPHRSYHRYQHFYIWFLFAMYGLIVSLRGKLNKKRFHFPIIEFSTFVLLPWLKNANFTSTFICFISFKMLAGFIFATIFSISHNNLKLQTNPLTNDFAKAQIQQTVNWGGTWSCLIFGGINYQIEHHLFPNIHPMIYPIIYQKLQRYCQRHNIQYIHYPSIFHAFYHTFLYIRHLGTFP